MSLTADVKAELITVRDPRPTARVAELTSLLRFSGGLHSIANRVAVEAEVDGGIRIVVHAVVANRRALLGAIGRARAAGILIVDLAVVVVVEAVVARVGAALGRVAR